MMIEKILEKIQELIDESFSNSLKGYTFASARNGAYQEVKKIVQEVAKEYGKDTNVRSKEYEKGYEDGYEDGAESVRALAPYEDGWIPCSERLPEDFRAVLITAIALNGTSYTELGKWNGEQWFHGASNTRIDIAEVIAWLELPAPYQKGE